jgi:hypothetical protein
MRGTSASVPKRLTNGAVPYIQRLHAGQLRPVSVTIFQLVQCNSYFQYYRLR